MTRLLVVAYLLEAGLLLIVAPWTNLWRKNFFADRWPWLDMVMTTNVAHVGVAVMGCLLIVAGLMDLHALWTGRSRRARVATEVPPKL